MTRSIWLGLLFAAVLGCKGNGDKPAGAAGAKPASAKPNEPGLAQDNTPESLRRLIEQLPRALEARDAQAFGALVASLTPDEAAVRKAVRDGVPADKVAALVAGAKKSFETIGVGFTGSEVHFATGKEIDEQSTPESGHFTGAELEASHDLLRPEMTYYTVTLTRPDDSKRFGLCFWDGAQWRVLGRPSD